MKKLLIVMAILVVSLMVTGTAHAALLGIKTAYENFFPDIDFDNSGVINYNATTNLFSLVAVDNKLVTPGGTTYWLSGPTFSTTLYLDVYVDESGNLTSGVTGYDMREVVTAGEVTIGSVTYGTGSVLLQANVDAFGWRYNSVSLVPSFDFLFDSASGGLVTQGLWPSPTPGTALWVETGGADYTWDADFTLIKAKGDKMVTPEPTSLLLLGSGLLGLAAFGKKRRKG